MFPLCQIEGEGILKGGEAYLKIQKNPTYLDLLSTFAGNCNVFLKVLLSNWLVENYL